MIMRLIIGTCALEDQVGKYNIVVVTERQVTFLPVQGGQLELLYKYWDGCEIIDACWMIG